MSDGMLTYNIFLDYINENFRESNELMISDMLDEFSMISICEQLNKITKINISNTKIFEKDIKYLWLGNYYTTPLFCIHIQINFILKLIQIIPNY